MRRALVGVACVALMMVAACGSGPAAPTEPSAAEPSAAPAAPRLDGVYRLTFDPATRLNGVPEPPSPSATSDGDWTFRSACAASGCVATAASIDPSQPVRVFDDLSGTWTFVAVQPEGWRCAGDEGPGSPMWTTWRIGAAPDGGLSGTVTEVGAETCPGLRERTIGLVKVDGAPAPVPDPAMEPARVPSAAQGLRGRYTWANRRRDEPTLPPVSVNYGVTTQCLRTGDRCVSSFVGETQPDGRFPVVAVNFVDGTWAQFTNGAVLTCAAGGQATGTRTYAIALPSPPVADPIERLTGEVRADFTVGDCPKAFVFETALKRTGD